MIYYRLLEKLNFNCNIDLYERKIEDNNLSYSLFFFSSLIDEYMIMNIQNSLRQCDDKNKVINYLDNVKVSLDSNIDNAILRLHEGQIILCVKDLEKLILVDIRKIPSRSVSESEVEKAIRGSKDGFTESLINNISLLRTRIKSNSLFFKSIAVGKDTKTNVVITYMNDKVNERKLGIIKKKIEDLSIDSLIMGEKALINKMFKESKSIFPIVRYTERPDVSALYLLKGHIILMVDTSSSVIILPVSIFDHMKSVEEYKEGFIGGNLTKIIRYLGILLSMFLLPISYLLTSNYDIQNIINSHIENTSVIPLWSQFLIGLFVIELFRIAIIHIPNSLSSTLSLVIGIILGEVSISLGIFMKDVLLLLSLFTIASYSIPSYELSLGIRTMNLVLLILSILFRNIGFLIGLICIFIHLVSLKILSYPYLYPLIPFDGMNLLHKMLKTSSKKNKKV